MGFFDDLQARADQSLNQLKGDVTSYLESRVMSAVVKVGEPAKGNLTAAQIAAGQTGAPEPIAPPSGGGSVQNSSQASQISMGLQQYALPLILALGIGFLVFSKKSRG